MDSRLRPPLFFGIFGSIVGLQLTSLAEYLFSFSFNRYVKICLVLSFPLLAAYLGSRFVRWKRVNLPAWIWLPNLITLFVFWAGGYFLTGALAYSGKFYSLWTEVDAAFPFVPEAVFVYLTVYPFFLLPAVYIDDMKRLAQFDIAQVIGLTISYLTFLVFPVAFPRPAISDSTFAEFVLSIVYGKDPPWNCFPSTHCLTCTISAIALLLENRYLGVWGVLSTLAICVSTMLTKQHFFLDVVSGVLLGSACYLLGVAFVRYLGYRITKSISKRNKS